MGSTRFDIVMQSCDTNLFSVGELPDRFRLTQNDLDDMQRDVELILRSVPVNGSIGAYGSYRRERW